MSFMFALLPVLRLKEPGTHPRRRQFPVIVVLLAHCGLLMSCASKNLSTSSGTVLEEQTPRIEYDAKGRIKGIFGLRRPSSDPTCRPQEYTVDFVGVERNEYLLFQLPSTVQVWVKVKGEMQEIFSDPQNVKAREFLSKQRKYRLKAYVCDMTGHTNVDTESIELLD